MPTRRPRFGVAPIVLTVAASSWSFACGSARSTGEPPESSEHGSDVILDAPPLEVGERITRLPDGTCEIGHPNGQARPIDGCPVTIRRGTATLVRRYDGNCFLDYDCPSTREAVCNPPEPDRVDCPAGSPPVMITRNPPAPGTVSP